MISIFIDQPALQFQGVEGDVQPGVGYHFDAIMRYTLDRRAVYTSYPIEFGADIQDHAYNAPDKMLIYGVTGSRELRFSVNQLPAIGAQAVIGNIGNSKLSAAAGIAAEFGADFGFLSGNTETRGGATLAFLTQLKESFSVFTVVTDLVSIPNMKIDRIIDDVNPGNETGLEFVAEVSQLRVVGPDLFSGNLIPNVPKSDPAISQVASLVDRGRIALA